MSINQDRIKYLLEQYAGHLATEGEVNELFAIIKQSEQDAFLKGWFTETLESMEPAVIYDQERWEKVAGEILRSTSRSERERQEDSSLSTSLRSVRPSAPIRVVWRRIAAAAAVLVFITAGYLFFTRNKTSEPTGVTVKNKNNDVNPGSYKARLTLADGSTVILDSAALGELAKQGNTAVINKDGQLVYQSGSGQTKGDILYNTVSTAKGETYSMILADGSKVWLNSASSIYFPVAFPGKERRIEVTGEVYVKVAHNPAQPFIASANGMEVLALGTEFNINAYPDEAGINATLIEGSVKVTKGTSTTTLKPGQQTELSGNVLSAARTVNIDEVTGWKEGFFHFESADLKTILRQFSRWYDVEVVYEGPVTNRKFFGIVKRSNTLKNVLEILRDNDIVFRIEGKKLIVRSG